MSTHEWRSLLLDWFAAEARPLPWRRHYHPYQVWISEIMLQQTQMERGVLYFERWLKRFPGVESVALASEEEILRFWEGLGYYSRARNLQASARLLVRDFGGRLPESLSALLSLPGVGQYTARAVLSIAFQQDYAVVDGNVERLFARLFAIDQPVKSSSAQARIWGLANVLLPSGQARAWNQALMEFGAVVCSRGTPRCDRCPLTVCCESFRTGSTAKRPVRAAGKERIEVSLVAAVIVAGGLVYVQQRPPSGLWASLWEFPGGHLEVGELPGEAVLREVREETKFVVALERPLPIFTYTYTRYRATLHPFLCRLSHPIEPVLHAARAYRWLAVRDLDTLGFSSGHRQLIVELKRRGGVLAP